MATVKTLAGGNVELSHAEPAMGTMFSFVVRAAADDVPAVLAGLDESSAWLHEVDRRFTTYQDDSDWLRYVRGECSLDDVHADIRHVVEQSRQLADETAGDFSLSADPSRPADPAAYVKGWAIQHATELLLAARAQSVFINGGGDIAVTSRSRPWRIGIQHPSEPGSLIAVIEVVHGAVATSGSYERGEHVYDPRTGTPAVSLSSATVTGPDLGRADAYSTALFAAGERGLEWFARIPDYGAYLVRSDGSARVEGAIRCVDRDGA